MITVFYDGSRKGGNNELLAQEVVKGIEHRAVYLQDMTIQPIVDGRHDEAGFQAVDDDYDQIIELLLKSEVLIFATPVYWYSMSGVMKVMIDRLSQAMRDERYPTLLAHLKTVKTIVVAVGGDEPRIKALPMIQQFHYIFDFLKMPFTHYIIGEGNKPGDVLKDAQAMTEAKQLNDRLK